MILDSLGTRDRWVLGLRGFYRLCSSEQAACTLRDTFQPPWAPTYLNGKPSSTCPSPNPQEPVIYLGKKPALGFQLHTRVWACSIMLGGMSPDLTQLQPLRDRGEAGLGREGAGKGVFPYSPLGTKSPSRIPFISLKALGRGIGPSYRGKSCTDEETEGQ